MARPKRTNRTAITGGKLALFEVLQAAQNSGSSQLSDAVAPIVSPGASAIAPAESGIVVVEPVRVATEETPPPAGSLTLEQAFAPRRARRQRPAGGVSLIGFATFVAGAIAVSGAGLIIFQHYSGRTPHAVSGTPPVPEVLDVRPGGTPSPTPTYARPADQTRTQVVAQGPGSPAVVPPDFRRVHGLNYVVVQSYSPSEEALAIATRDALLNNGVGSTIETGIPGWGSRLCVVGTEGFEQISTAKFDNYRRRLLEVSATATAANKRIRKFEPTAFQWGRS